MISKYLTMQSQRSVRGLYVRLFINEDDEIGDLILGLCFPIVPIAAERPRLKTGENENGRGQAGHREGTGLRRAGRRYSWAG